MNVEEAAKIIHQANKAYCEVLGDFSQKDWDQTPEEIKNSVVHGIKFHLKYAPDNITAASSHANWLSLKEDEGWTHGETKDIENKTHPCFMPFNQLPVEQRTKDHLFKNTVDALRVLIDIADNGG